MDSGKPITTLRSIAPRNRKVERMNRGIEEPDFRNDDTAECFSCRDRFDVDEMITVNIWSGDIACPDCAEKIKEKRAAQRAEEQGEGMER